MDRGLVHGAPWQKYLREAIVFPLPSLQPINGHRGAQQPLRHLLNGEAPVESVLRAGPSRQLIGRGRHRQFHLSLGKGYGLSEAKIGAGRAGA